LEGKTLARASKRGALDLPAFFVQRARRALLIVGTQAAIKAEKRYFCPQIALLSAEPKHQWK
jgi:CO dehydrogenase/acetyl-CoA synthase epsilon subunit